MKLDLKYRLAFLTLLGAGIAHASESILPNWLSDCSVGLKEGYDNNVFLSDARVPVPFTVPSGSVAALKDRASWISTVSPAVGINFAPLFGDQTNISQLSLKYTPDFVIYHNASSESYDAHRLAAAIDAGSDSFTFDASDNFTFIDGNRVGPFYPGGLFSSFATTADRERRRQIQDRANVSAQFGLGDFFVRPVASLLYYDLMTDLRNLPGYQNYSDRADVNGGVDFGYRVMPDLAVTLGYRYGYQYQQQFTFSPYSSPNDYQRLLFGIEGKPWSWLNIKIVSGPDFRSYQGDSTGHITPLNDLNPVKYYGEAMVTATLTPKDSLIFKYKAWQWVAGIGKVPYYESFYDLAYRRKLTDKLTVNVGGTITSWDFSDSNLPGIGRHDQEYTVNLRAEYAFNPHFSVALNGTLNCGRNTQNDVTNPGNREFDEQLVSLETKLAF